MFGNLMSENDWKLYSLVLIEKIQSENRPQMQ